MAERAGVFLTDPDKSPQTDERQVVEVRAGEGESGTSLLHTFVGGL